MSSVPEASVKTSLNLSQDLLTCLIFATVEMYRSEECQYVHVWIFMCIVLLVLFSPLQQILLTTIEAV